MHGYGHPSYPRTGERAGAMLNQRITSAGSIDELVVIFSEHGREMNHIHLSACWASLGRLTR